jgi:hypothetical protein
LELQWSLFQQGKLSSSKTYGLARYLANTTLRHVFGSIFARAL